MRAYNILSHKYKEGGLEQQNRRPHWGAWWESEEDIIGSNIQAGNQGKELSGLSTKEGIVELSLAGHKAQEQEWSGCQITSFRVRNLELNQSQEQANWSTRSRNSPMVGGNRIADRSEEVKKMKPKQHLGIGFSLPIPSCLCTNTYLYLFKTFPFRFTGENFSKNNYLIFSFFQTGHLILKSPWRISWKTWIFFFRAVSYTFTDLWF